MNIWGLAKEYCSYYDLDGWRYDEHDLLFVFWKKGFGTEVSTFEKLTESDLINWDEKRKIEEEKHRKRIQEIRNERKASSTSNSELGSPSQVKNELKEIDNQIDVYQKKLRLTANEEMELTKLKNRRDYLLEKISQKIILYEWNVYYNDSGDNKTIGEVNGKWFLRSRRRRF